MCRVICNCSERLRCQDRKNKYVNHYIKRLQYSGCDERKKCEILNKALKKHVKKKEVGGNGQRRSRMSDASYLEDGKNETVIFVNSTPGEILKKKIERVARN